MTYLIELDGKTEASKKILSSIRKLQKQDSSVKISLKKKKTFRPLTAADMALPGRKKPTKEQIEEYLDREEGDVVYTMDEVRKRIEKRLSKLRKK